MPTSAVVKLLLLVLLWPAPRVVVHNHDHLARMDRGSGILLQHIERYHRAKCDDDADNHLMHFHWSMPGDRDIGFCGYYAFATEELKSSEICHWLNDLLSCPLASLKLNLPLSELTQKQIAQLRLSKYQISFQADCSPSLRDSLTLFTC